MSEVDRLSTSGTYPALALSGKRRERGDPQHSQQAPVAEKPETKPTEAPSPRNPKSLIDEYA